LPRSGHLIPPFDPKNTENYSKIKNSLHRVYPKNYSDSSSFATNSDYFTLSKKKYSTHVLYCQEVAISYSGMNQKSEIIQKKRKKRQKHKIPSAGYIRINIQKPLFIIFNSNCSKGGTQNKIILNLQFNYSKKVNTKNKVNQKTHKGCSVRCN